MRSSSVAIPTSSRLRRPAPPGEVKHRWEHLKTEQEERGGIFHHVPGVLPALLYAHKVRRRAATVGFDYPDVAGTLADVDDELAELRAELEGKQDPAAETEPDHPAAELGDVLFGVANVARRLNVDPELELRRATDRFRARVEDAERLAGDDAPAFAELALEEQDRYFDRAKERE